LTHRGIQFFLEIELAVPHLIAAVVLGQADRVVRKRVMKADVNQSRIVRSCCARRRLSSWSRWRCSALYRSLWSSS
jgi:hypothetical protein